MDVSLLHTYVRSSLCCDLKNIFLFLSAQIITSSQFTLNDRSSKEMYDMALKAVHLLTSWSTAIMEMVRGGEGGVGMGGVGWEGEEVRELEDGRVGIWD